MLRTLVSIAMHWTVRGQSLRHVRCARCHEIYSEGTGGRFLTTATFTMRTRPEGSTTTDAIQTPAEWVCSCGRKAPLEIGELLTNDTMVQCRRRWICRNRWQVPAGLEWMTCPCCWTAQPGPNARGQ